MPQPTADTAEPEPEPEPDLAVQPAAAVAAPAPEMATETRSRGDGKIGRSRRIQQKNRRRMWLSGHPDYFSSELEAADPLLYDLMIRRWQSAEEREREGRKRGTAGVLEASILRGEARMEELRSQDGIHSSGQSTSSATHNVPRDQVDANGLPTPAPVDKYEAAARWRDMMAIRFIRGEDDEFDYASVDDEETWDDHDETNRTQFDEWVDTEPPAWDVEASHADVPVQLKGETGVQDF